MSFATRKLMRSKRTAIAEEATLHTPSKKEIAMRLVSSAENSSLNWQAQYRYIEDIDDGRGYTAGIIGFCSGTGDMLELIQYYATINPGNILQAYIPELEQIMAANYSNRPTLSHSLLDPNFVPDWRSAADNDPSFKQAQNHERDLHYFNPSVNQAINDGLGVLGQFIYYDAIVMHGPGSSWDSFGGMRGEALNRASTPAQGGNETTYLHAFLDVRKEVMLSEAAHSDTTRVDTAQRVFLNNGNLGLNPPLNWSVYGDPFSIPTEPNV